MMVAAVLAEPADGRTECALIPATFLKMGNFIAGGHVMPKFRNAIRFALGTAAPGDAKPVANF